MDTVRWWTQLAVATVVVILVAIAVGAFLLAFRGQVAYMVTVARYPASTAWTGPAVVEGTLAMTLLAGLVLDLRPWTWAWAVIWGAMAMAGAGSVFGNVYVARLQGMAMAGVVTHGSWSVWVIVSELVAVIVVKRAWPRRPQPILEIEVPFGRQYEAPAETLPSPPATGDRVTIHRHGGHIAPLRLAPDPDLVIPAPTVTPDPAGLRLALAAAIARGSDVKSANVLEPLGARFGYSLRQTRRYRDEIQAELDAEKAQVRS